MFTLVKAMFASAWTFRFTFAPFSSSSGVGGPAGLVMVPSPAPDCMIAIPSSVEIPRIFTGARNGGNADLAFGDPAFNLFPFSDT